LLCKRLLKTSEVLDEFKTSFDVRLVGIEFLLRPLRLAVIIKYAYRLLLLLDNEREVLVVWVKAEEPTHESERRHYFGDLFAEVG